MKRPAPSRALWLLVTVVVIGISSLRSSSLDPAARAEISLWLRAENQRALQAHRGNQEPDSASVAESIRLDSVQVREATTRGWFDERVARVRVSIPAVKGASRDTVRYFEVRRPWPGGPWRVRGRGLAVRYWIPVP